MKQNVSVVETYLTSEFLFYFYFKAAVQNIIGIHYYVPLVYFEILKYRILSEK